MKRMPSDRFPRAFHPPTPAEKPACQAVRKSFFATSPQAGAAQPGRHRAPMRCGPPTSMRRRSGASCCAPAPIASPVPRPTPRSNPCISTLICAALPARRRHRGRGRPAHPARANLVDEAVQCSRLLSGAITASTPRSAWVTPKEAFLPAAGGDARAFQAVERGRNPGLYRRLWRVARQSWRAMRCRHVTDRSWTVMAAPTPMPSACRSMRPSRCSEGRFSIRDGWLNAVAVANASRAGSMFFRRGDPGSHEENASKRRAGSPALMQSGRSGSRRGRPGQTGQAMPDLVGKPAAAPTLPFCSALPRR